MKGALVAMVERETFIRGREREGDEEIGETKL